MKIALIGATRFGWNDSQIYGHHNGCGIIDAVKQGGVKRLLFVGDSFEIKPSVQAVNRPESPK
jgi:putative NADH-flavin reductase